MARAFASGEVDVAYTDQDKLTAARRAHRPVPEARLVAGLRARRDVRGSPARGQPGADRRGRAVSTPSFDGIQDFDLLLRLSERTQRIAPHPEGPLPLARDPGQHRRRSGREARDPRAPGARRERPPAPSWHRGRGRAPSVDPPPASACAPRPALARPPVTCRDLARRERDARPLPFGAARAHQLPGDAGHQRACADGRGERGGTASASRQRAPRSTPAGSANLAAAAPRGEYLVFLGEDTEVTEPDWIEQLLLYAQMPGVGAVAPTLVAPRRPGRGRGRRDRALRPGGAGDAGHRRPTATATTARSPAPARSRRSRWSACSSARSAFEQAGGFEAGLQPPVPGPRPLHAPAAERGLSSVCAPAPRTISHATEALSPRRLRRDRPGAVRGPLVRAARGRRPLLTTAASSARAADYTCRASHGTRAARAAGGRRVRVLFLHFGKLHVNSVIQAFHFGEEMTARGHRGRRSAASGPTDRIRDGRRAELRLHQLRGAGGQAPRLGRRTRADR